MISYSSASALLTLEHRLQEDTCPVFALVDVKLVLESLGSEQVRTGEWVNVMGYITGITAATGSKGSSHRSSRVRVQALLLWSAGPLDLQRYEASVKGLEG